MFETGSTPCLIVSQWGRGEECVCECVCGMCHSFKTQTWMGICHISHFHGENAFILSPTYSNGMLGRRKCMCSEYNICVWYALEPFVLAFFLKTRNANSRYLLCCFLKRLWRIICSTFISSLVVFCLLSLAFLDLWKHIQNLPLSSHDILCVSFCPNFLFLWRY